jgi:hypothetical protein
MNAKPKTPSNPPAPGTVDLTNLVESVRASFVSFAVEFVTQAAASIPYLQWLMLPVIFQAFQASLRWAIDTLSRAAEMRAFFLATALRKRGQAKDFIRAVEAMRALPKTASKEDYANAEKKRMVAFRNFVLLTN